MSNENIEQLTDANFAEKTKTGITLVDFWAPWCGPCRMQEPILKGVADKVGAKAKVAQVNVDDNPQTAVQFGVRSIPTIIVLKDGRSVKEFVGVQQEKALLAAIDAAVAN